MTVSALPEVSQKPDHGDEWLHFESMRSSEFLRRSISGLWFAAASLIPIGYCFIALEGSAGIPIFSDSLVFIGLLALVLAAVGGALLGSSILHHEDVNTGGQAALRGLGVASLTYVLLFSIPFLIYAFRSDDIIGLAAVMAISFFMGLLVVGWLVALVGAAAGFLLFIYRERIVDR